ncbi:response regulator transcription factor [Paenibacillus sedimenti]|uniref:Response regulator transcription factor n=1 Tax=Paenibacillus sedimenti TaxID=2770274 RepID=A0A926QHM3_9BACL|nr:response regulator transcription factor [Paenibacillus sedimenti]MBD0379660.1 response regulator transcription factor [Paenibacillus sedimenti]
MITDIIKVLIVEDDPFWQKRLSADLDMEADIHVVGVAGSRSEALELAETNDFDVVLMDIQLTTARLDGLDTTRDMMVAKGGKLKIIMLTSLDDQDVIVKSFQNGAVNYITKSSYSDIVQAIRDAYHSIPTLHADSIPAVMKEMKLSLLTPVEKEVYLLKERGMSKPEIAGRLHKSVNTIKTQLRTIKNKLLKLP